MSLKYDAFISYRHAPLDMEMAKKVHTALETYHIPRSVQVKTGKKKMGRVFRDQEELPIGSDLDDNISTALSTSDYLLVICSPRTPDSYWVCKEIETFIEMHGREHILAVLIEGEPDESFPKLLLTDDDGNPVEPLAADIRGETPKERNAKFKTEKLRLAAPIIGCTYDDLKQRHRERMIRRMVTIVSSIAAVVAIAGTAFGLYSSNVAAQMKQLADEKSQLADEKTQLAEEILAEYKQKQENQSRFYAEESLSLLRSGNREDAILVAKAALPGPDNDRPYVAEAEYALSEALYAYDPGMSLKFDRILSSDMTVTDISRSSNKRYLLVIDSGNNVYVYDSEDWSLKLRVEPEIKEGGYTVSVKTVDADETGVYIASENSLTKYDYNGEVVYENTDMSDIGGGVINAEAGMTTLVNLKEISFVNTATGATVSIYENEDEMNFSSYRLMYDDERQIAIVGHYSSDAEHAYVSIYNPENGRIATGTATEGCILDMYQTQSGNIAMISANSDYVSIRDITRMCVDLVSPEGNHLWNRDIDANIRSWATFDAIVKAHDYDTAEGEHRGEIDVVVEDELYTYDESDGHLINYMKLREDVVSMAVALNSPGTYLSYINGDVDIYNGNSGEMYSGMLIDTDLEQMDTEYLNSQAVIRSYMSSDLHVMAYQEASDLITLEEHNDTQVILGTAPDASYYVLSPLGNHTEIDFYDADGQPLYTYNGTATYDLDTGFVGNIYKFISHDSIISIDPVAGTADERTWASLGIDEYISNANISRNGDYAALWGSRVLYVMDMSKPELIWSMETENYVSDAFVSDDGSRMIVYESGHPIYSVDTDDSEIHELDERLTPHGEASMDKFVAVSADGKRVAMFCMDGMVRVADAESGEVICEIPDKSRLRCFIRFTPDDKYLMVQGDDAKLHICDATTGDTVTVLELEATVTDVIYDEDDGDIAVSVDEVVYLLDAESYGLKAKVAYGATYLKGNNRFLIRYNGRQMFMTTYKDYQTLLAEADALFPDSVLDEERRIKYNIE